MSLTCLPHRVSQGLRVLGPCFRYRPQRGFSWLGALPGMYGERAHVKALARHGPKHLASQQYQRLWGRWAATAQALGAQAAGDRTRTGTCRRVSAQVVDRGVPDATGKNDLVSPQACSLGDQPPEGPPHRGARQSYPLGLPS